jgi:hypothetical protein
MTNGNDMVEHIEGCEECQKKNNEYYDNPNLTEKEKEQLSQEMYECYCGSFGE